MLGQVPLSGPQPAGAGADSALLRCHPQVPAGLRLYVHLCVSACLCVCASHPHVPPARLPHASRASRRRCRPVRANPPPPPRVPRATEGAAGLDAHWSPPTAGGGGEIHYPNACHSSLLVRHADKQEPRPSLEARRAPSVLRADPRHRRKRICGFQKGPKMRAA